MDIVKSTPILTSVTRTGKNKYWQGFVVTDGEFFYTVTKHWQDNMIGGQSKVQTSPPKAVNGTNLNRANERTALEQALFNLDSMVNKQNDKGYCGEGVEKKTLPLPMLANRWKDKKRRIQYPAFVQPKLDGVRMLMGNGVCWSRLGKPFIPEVVEHLIFDTAGYILDGELIYEGASFQDTIRAVKKFRGDSANLTYHVFDIVDTERTFSDRLSILKNLLEYSDAPGGVKCVTTTQINDEDELLTAHKAYIKAGYEGTIIRNRDGLYQVGQRSSDLLKHKDFDDAEFEIIDVVEGSGKDKGAAIFVCKTHTGGAFKVRPKGSMESRQSIWEDAYPYIGKMLTVRYQGTSEGGIPRFPVGLSMRDAEIQG
jgi:galactitol-specific phosphotransferase system IIB component